MRMGVSEILVDEFVFKLYQFAFTLHLKMKIPLTMMGVLMLVIEAELDFMLLTIYLILMMNLYKAKITNTLKNEMASFILKLRGSSTVTTTTIAVRSAEIKKCDFKP